MVTRVQKAIKDSKLLKQFKLRQKDRNQRKDKKAKSLIRNGFSNIRSAAVSFGSKLFTATHYWLSTADLANYH